MEIFVAGLILLFSHIPFVLCKIPAYLQNSTILSNTTSNSTYTAGVWADIRSPSITCDFSTNSFVSVSRTDFVLRALIPLAIHTFPPYRLFNNPLHFRKYD
jgi:hypothetical protein